MTSTMTKEVVCFKCSGERKLYNFTHIENGLCFRCNGTGMIKVKPINRVFPAAEVDNTRTVTRGEVSLVINDETEVVIVMFRGEIQGQAVKMDWGWSFSDGLTAAKWNAVKRAIAAGV